ncbi:MAG TPA: ATP-binding protein [Opitutaceae bacterium]|nr:ATP-binding protein [Opitutaceae bacterium]HND60974.1 ATP-binding protein [Opitutaceae bacterium]
MSAPASEPNPSTAPADLPSGSCAVLVLDEAGRVTAANASAAALWGRPAAELAGTAFAGLLSFEVTSNEPDWLEAQWEIVVATALDQSARLAILPQGGATRDMIIRLEKNLAGPGYIATALPPAAPAAIGATGDDASFRLLSDKGAAGFFDLNLKDGHARYSPAWKKILGYADAELPDTLDQWRQLIHPDDSGAAPDQLGKKLAVSSRPFVVEFRMKHRRGHWVWIQCIGLQVAGPDGELERVVGLHLDVTERKELEEESIANDARMQELSSTGPLGAFTLDFADKSAWYSPAWQKLLGWDDDDCARGLAAFTAALPAAEVTAGPEVWLLKHAVGQNTFVLPVQLQDKAGKVQTFLLGANRLLTRKRDLAKVTGFICPVPEGLATPAANALPSGLAGEALSTVAEGIILVDDRGKIAYLNGVAARLLCRSAESTRGQPVGEVFRLVHRESGRPADDPLDTVLGADKPLPLISEHALVAAAEGLAPTPVVWTARTAADPSGKPCGAVFVFRDPNEMNLTPEELVKANRFEALGLLAGGIAHDFNNLLTTIMGGISLAKDTRDYSSLDDSEKACLTAKGLTKQLLTFAKGGAGTLTVQSARDILTDTVKIAAAGSDAQVTVETAPDTSPISVDRAQILQVFQNLVVNALQAMPPAPHRPKVQMRARNVALAEGQVAPLPAGNYVEFEVRDNGSGIPAHIVGKIFDPFFTTKKHGTGLGLATVLGIVRKHGGQIGLDTQEGVGTAFTVYLPTADRPVEVQARRAASLRFGTGRILFMDDDPKISAITASMLKSLDYKFDLAHNGEEAITFYKRYLNIGRPYDAVIMDISVIGGMGGEETFKVLRELDPDVRAIVSSGYDNDDMAKKFLDQGFCGYLTKPYRVAELGKVLKTVIG